ncbi:MAG: hypothetical protein ACRYF0_07735 [Janthinobacterium lividum]
MKQIREWLEEEGGDYATGLALYEAHGRSSVVLSALRYGETMFTRQKLRAELRKLLETHPPAPAVAPRPAKSAPVRPAVTAPPVASPPEPPDVPDEVREQRSSWYAERHRLHATLELLATDEEREVAGERILVISELLTASYQAPVAAVPRPDLSLVRDQGEIRRLLANLRPQVSKLKKNPARALDLQQAQADIKLLERNLLKP